MNRACCPCRCRHARGGRRRTWPRSDSGRQRTAGLHCADPCTPSDAQAHHTDTSDLTPGPERGISAGARSGNPAHRSTTDWLGRRASGARPAGSPRLRPRGEQRGPRVSGRTCRAADRSGTRLHRTGRPRSRCATGSGRTVARAAAGSSALRRARRRPCFGLSCRRGRVCTWSPIYYTMCQGCHLHYDRDHHAATRAAARAAEIAANNTPLPIGEAP